MMALFTNLTKLSQGNVNAYRACLGGSVGQTTGLRCALSVWPSGRGSPKLRQLSFVSSAITINRNIIKPSSVVLDLGILFDAERVSRQHVSRVSQACFFHLRRIRSVRRQLGRDVTAELVTAVVLSRRDHCNGVLASLPATTLTPLQRILHAAAHTVLDLKLGDHVTSALRELHWLPITERIE